MMPRLFDSLESKNFWGEVMIRHSVNITFYLSLFLPVFLAAQLASGQGVELAGQIGGECRDAALAGNFAYISEGPNFKVLDISNPAQPVLVGKLLLADLINRIVVSGTVAWVANSQKGLVAVDISNPAAPQARGSLQFPGPAASL